MADGPSRRQATLFRLRAQLRKKRESLADQFDFKMYLIILFKDPKKVPALFEIAEVVPVMTNNYEESILRGVKEEAYSLESSLELLEKDVVQFHAPRYQSMRKDVIGCTQEMDFFLWPRNDIESLKCLLFSKWKGDPDDGYKPLKADFDYNHVDYERQLVRLLGRRDKTGLIINNPAQSMFMFVDRQHLQTSKSKAIVFKLSSLCLYLPQDQLTHWGPGTVDELLAPYLH